MEFGEALKTVVAASETLVTWCLATLGASVAAIVGTGYLRPPGRWFRQIYLLFLPGWLFLGISLFHGAKVPGLYVTAQLTDEREKIREIFHAMNQASLSQQTTFSIALVFFGIWLVLFLLWWIYGQQTADIAEG